MSGSARRAWSNRLAAFGLLFALAAPCLCAGLASRATADCCESEAALSGVDHACCDRDTEASPSPPVTSAAPASEGPGAGAASLALVAPSAGGLVPSPAPAGARLTVILRI
jgi:hypothetical protein